MKKKVFVLGSFNVDIVARVPRFPLPGETIASVSSIICAGGKGANQAYATAQNDVDVTFVTKLGKDQFSAFAKEHLQQTSISNPILLACDNHPTGTALIYSHHSSGENMIVVNGGANQAITLEEMHKVQTEISRASLFLTQLETNMDVILAALIMAKAHQLLTMLNPAPYHPELNKLLPYVDILTPNESEASQLTNMEVNNFDSAKQAATVIQGMGVKTVIITRGSGGVLILNADECIEIPAFPCKVVDTTGAGDAFNGALAAQLAQGVVLVDAATYACAFASLAVERMGAANLPDGHEVQSRLAPR